MVGIVADSACALPSRLAAAERVNIVPLLLEIDGQPTPEEAVTPAEVTRLAGEGKVRTAGPSPGGFLAAIEAADDGEGVLVLTVGRRYSSAADSARLAARQTDRRVEVLDTGTAAGAEALVVLAAAAGARAGLGLDPLVKQADGVAQQVRLVAAVGDLAPLGRSGRLPRPLASLGNAVGLRPVFELRQGAIRLLRPGLSESAAFNLITETWRRSIRPGHRLHVAAMHAGDAAGADRLLATVTRLVDPATCLSTRFGPAMVAHTGPTIVGLAWWWEPDQGDDGPGRT